MVIIMSLILKDIDDNEYSFNLYQIKTTFPEFGGIYLFTYKQQNDKWLVLYIGQTGDFSDRIDDNLKNHHKYKCAVNNGATHIGLLGMKGGKIARKQVEEDLIFRYKPKCNEQGK